MTMDEMKSVVLEVNEGRGFENYREDIILLANLDGAISKTLPARSTRDGNVYFNNELVWEIQKKYLRRMKISSTPLKIECYSVQNHDQKQRIGYLSLKLKSIKEAQSGDYIESEWMKLLGVKSEGRPSAPSVLLKFYLQESQHTKEIAEMKGDDPLPMEYIPLLTQKKGLIQIGPIDDHTENFILGIKLTEMKNLNLLCPEGFSSEGGYVFLYTLLGYDIQREPFTDLSFPTPQEKMVIKLMSTIPTLKLYLESNPYLTVRLMCRDVVLGFSRADLRPLIPENGISCLPTSAENHLRFLSPKNSEKEDESFVNLLLTFDLLEKDDISSNAPPSLASHKGDDSSWGSATEAKKPVGEYSLSTRNQRKNLNSENILPDNGNNKIELPGTVNKSGNSNTKPHADDALIYKLVEELEDWKEMQKEMFIDKMKKKEKQHLDLLSSEWHIKRERLECNLSKVISQNQILMDSLKNSIADLQERKNKVAEKEKLLKFVKDDVERRYNLKLQDLQAASKRMEEDCNHKVELLETQNSEQELKYLDLQREHLILKEKVKDLEAEVTNLNKSSLTKDQTASLLTEVKSLQEKLDIADQSKTFFKQQWAKAVREIHRLKTENQESLQIQIKHNKEELRKLGLCKSPGREANTDNEEPRLPNHIQKIIDRQVEMSESGDAIDSIGSKIRLPHLQKSSCTSSSVDDKLQNLIEERNALLRTGSYTIDDAAVAGLNQQIRSLMTTCSTAL